MSEQHYTNYEYNQIKPGKEKGKFYDFYKNGAKAINKLSISFDKCEKFEREENTFLGTAYRLGPIDIHPE